MVEISLQAPKEKIHDFHLRPAFLVGCSDGDQGRGLRFPTDGLLQRQRDSYSMVLLLPDHSHWMDFRYVSDKWTIGKRPCANSTLLATPLLY